MARPRRGAVVRRYHLTLDPQLADRLVAYAATTHQPISTAAAALITDALSGEHADVRLALHETRRQLEEMAARLRVLQDQLAGLTGRTSADQQAARWEWPVEMILADAVWWDRWLPRLHELLGRRLAPILSQPGRTASDETNVDGRGYNDLMGFLFPPIVRAGHQLTWRSPEYPIASGVANPRHGSLRTGSRGDVWEAVIRHVAEALSLLESTGQAGSDPYMRLRAEAEITGPWTRVLLYLVGEDEPHLPQQRLA
jgi:hypothetical protein